MVIDVTNMRHIRLKIADHGPQSTSSFYGINCMCSASDFCSKAWPVLEIDVRDEVVIVGGRVASRIGHGKQGDLMSVRTHQIHQFKQIDLGATERKVIFVAVQNSHRASALSVTKCFSETGRQNVAGSLCD